jgi:hypothetical protein
MAITRLTGADNSTLTWETIAPSSGDLVILFFVNDGGDDQTTPADLTRLDTDDGSTVEAGCYYRICTGSESGTLIADEGSFGVSDEEYCWHLIKIPTGEWQGTTPPEMTRASDNSNPKNLDPPSHTASWGSETDNIWIAAGCRDDDDGISALDSNYDANFAYTESSASNNSCEICSSWRTNTSDTEDPGAATHTGTGEECLMWTVAIRPFFAGEIRTVASKIVIAFTSTRLQKFLRTVSQIIAELFAVSRTITGTGLNASNVTSVGDSAETDNLVTGSISPPSGALILVSADFRQVGGTPSSLNITDSFTGSQGDILGGCQW